MNDITTNYNRELNNTIKYFNDFIANFHFGRVNVNILKNINIKINNISVNIFSLANISVLDKITLKVTPYDGKNINAIKKEIFKHNIGGSIFVKEDSIIIKLSLFTEEKRLELIKKIKIELEKNINILRLIRNKYKKLLKNNNNFSEDEKKNLNINIQDIYSKYIERLNNTFKKKKLEILNFNK